MSAAFGARVIPVLAVRSQGCGESEGLPGLITDYEHLVTDALAFVETQRVVTEKPAFVLGTSAGGALALMSIIVAPPGTFAGCIVLSPLVVISEAARPSAMAQRALRLLGALVPAWPPFLLRLQRRAADARRAPTPLRAPGLVTPWAALISGSSSDPCAQYADPTLREACVSDPLAYHGKMRIATAAALLKLRCVAPPAAAWRALAARARAEAARAFCACARFLSRRRSPRARAQRGPGGRVARHHCAFPGAPRHGGHGG